MLKDPFLRKAFIGLISIFAVVGIGFVVLLETSGIRIIREPVTHTDVFTDVAKLESRIRLPIEPQRVQWQVSTFSEVSRIDVIPGGAYSLVVVLDYTPEQIQQLKLLAGAQPKAESGSMAQRSLQNWLPEMIHAAAAPTGDERLLQINLPAYDPEAFIHENLGWRPGFWTPLEDTSQVLLVLWNMN